MNDYNNLKSKILTLRISEEFYSELKEQAEITRKSVSEIVREKFYDGDTVNTRLDRIEKKIDKIVEIK